MNQQEDAGSRQWEASHFLFIVSFLSSYEGIRDREDPLASHTYTHTHKIQIYGTSKKSYPTLILFDPIQILLL